MERTDELETKQTLLIFIVPEIGCAGPTIVKPPVETQEVRIGETVTITCEAVGFPTPLISWRLNWGNVPPPPRVTATSADGVGVLTIRNFQESDQGAYSCEVRLYLFFSFSDKLGWALFDTYQWFIIGCEQHERRHRHTRQFRHTRGNRQRHLSTSAVQRGCQEPQ